MYFKFFNQEYLKAGTKIYDSAGKEWGKIKGGIATPLTKEVTAYVVGTGVLPASALKVGDKVSLINNIDITSLEKFGSDRYIEIDADVRHLTMDGYKGPLYLKLPTTRFPDSQLAFRLTAEALLIEESGTVVPVNITPKTFVVTADGKGQKLEGLLSPLSGEGAVYLALRPYGNTENRPFLKVAPAHWVTRIANQSLYLAAGSHELEHLPEMKRPAEVAALKV